MTSIVASESSSFLEEVTRIGRQVAAVHADEVDRDARFPVEAVDALREIGALSAWVPRQYGGAGLELSDIAGACRELARGCSSTGMVFAMHQLQVANLFRHLDPQGWHAGYLERLVVEQRLIASITSEIGTGGDMAQSIAALTPAGAGRVRFEKQAPTISYGAHCDDFLTSLRRSPEAPGADQVMVLHARADTEMIPAGQWDTLGMRGTCSPGATVRAEFAAEQVMAGSFATMMSETIVPVSHILWANVWLGIGIEAFERGRAFLKAAARRAPGQPQPAGRKLSEILLELRMIRAEVDAAAEDFGAWDRSENRAALDSLAAGLRFNSLKLAVSERVPHVCQTVLGAVGIAGYRNDSPYAVGRQLRDSLSGQLMIANDRLHATNAGLLAIAKDI